MIKFLKFRNTTGQSRILNVEACDIVKLKDVNTIEIFNVPYDNAVVLFEVTRVAGQGEDFDGALVDLINDAIIRAEQTSYTNVMVDVDVNLQKYHISDVIQIP
jgi:hypothetical protein